MKKNQIQSMISDFMTLKLGKTVDEKNIFSSLTGDEWKLTPIEMLYLFHDIENLFSISIPADKLVNYQFNTIEGIVDIVHSLKGSP